MDDILLFSFEGVEISASSDFEFGDSGIFLDEDGCIRDEVHFLAGLPFLLAADLLSLRRVKNSLADLTYLGCVNE